MTRFESLTANVPYRVLMGGIGIVVAMIGLFLLFALVRRFANKDVDRARKELQAIADAGHWGELPRVVAIQRMTLPLAFAFLVAGWLAISIAVEGSNFSEVNLWLGGKVIAVLIAACFVARELGLPDFMQPRESRGVPGLTRWRVAQRRERAGGSMGK